MNRKRIFVLKVLAILCRVLAVLTKFAVPITVILFFTFDTGPHLRVKAVYRGQGTHRIYQRCTYLGSRGVVRLHPASGKCPVLTILNAKQERR
jgi:hypothetical protein